MSYRTFEGFYYGRTASDYATSKDLDGIKCYCLTLVYNDKIKDLPDNLNVRDFIVCRYLI